MNLLARISSSSQTVERSTHPALSWDGFQSIVAQSFLYDGVTYGIGSPDPEAHFSALYEAVALESNVIMAAVAARASVMSQVRFVWRDSERGSATHRQLLPSEDLALLERPDPGNLTRPEMLSIGETQVAFAGCSYVRRHPDRLEVLNPELVDVVMFGVDDADAVIQRKAGRKAGYIHWAGGRDEPGLAVPLELNEVWHHRPEPHPVKWWSGVSWVTSLLQEMAIDRSSTRYLRQFFDKAATPNLIVKPHETLSSEQIDQYRDVFAKQYAGVNNAFRTMWLGGGSDVMVVGSRLADLDLKSLQGGSETRIAARARIPAPILGIREALQGSALTTGNYGAARRQWADVWFAHEAASLCAAVEAVYRPPVGREMWFDPADILLLQEDAQDAAQIMATQAAALHSLDSAGYDADAAVAAVRDGNLTALVGNHDGLQSVQRNPTGTQGDSDG